MRAFACVAVGLLAGGCLASMPHPSTLEVDAAATKWPGLTLADLERGRETYVTRCSACHLTPSPTRYTAERWPRLLDEMAARAHLSDAQREDVLHYLVALSQPPRDLRSSR